MTRSRRPSAGLSARLATPAPARARSPIQLKMPCPDCGTGIDLPLGALVAGQPIWCSGCGLKLDIDREGSASALAQVQRSLATLETVRERAPEPTAGSPR